MGFFNCFFMLLLFTVILLPSYDCAKGGSTWRAKVAKVAKVPGIKQAVSLFHNNNNYCTKDYPYKVDGKIEMITGRAHSCSGLFTEVLYFPVINHGEMDGFYFSAAENVPQMATHQGHADISEIEPEIQEVNPKEKHKKHDKQMPVPKTPEECQPKIITKNEWKLSKIDSKDGQYIFKRGSKEVYLAVTNIPAVKEKDENGNQVVKKEAYKTCKLWTHEMHVTNDARVAVYNCPKEACENGGALFYFEKSFWANKQKSVNWLNANLVEGDNQVNHYGKIVDDCNLSLRQIHREQGQHKDVLAKE